MAALGNNFGVRARRCDNEWAHSNAGANARRTLLPPILRGIARAFLFGAVALTTAGCGRNRTRSTSPSPRGEPVAVQNARAQPKPAIVSGTVRDASTGSPLVAALVEWTSGNRRTRGSTDAMGAFAFAIPVPEGHDRAQDFAVSVSAWSNLNEAAGRKVAARSSEITTVNFSLNSKPSAEIGGVRGRVTNAATGQGVPGVAISIVGAGGDLAILTQADGSYAFPRVGLGRILVIRALPQKPPCLVPTERSFNMVQPVAIEDFPLANAFTTAVHCPTVAGGPPGHLQ